MINKFFKNSFFFFLTIIFFSILFEISFRFYIKFAKIYDIEMYKYAKELKIPSKIPGLIHEHKPNSQANLMKVDININSHGFRDNTINQTKQENEKRILIAGSSITMGWGVPYDSIFTSLIENQLNNNPSKYFFEVINSGIGNYNTHMQKILLIKNIEKFNPDKVILHYFLNDAEIIKKRKSNFIIKNNFDNSVKKNVKKVIGEIFK